MWGKGCCGNCIKGIRLATEAGVDKDKGSPCTKDFEERSRGSLSIGSTVVGIGNVVNERDGEDAMFTLVDDTNAIGFVIERC